MLSTDRIAFFIFAIAATWMLIPLLIRIANKTGTLSKIDFRRKDAQQTPLLGGLPVILLTLGYQIYVDATAGTGATLSFALPVLLLTFVTLIDDKCELSARPKFLVQLVAVATWLAFTPSRDLLLTKIGVNPLLAQALTGFWVLGLINAMNMLDGLDGLATGLAAIASLTLATFTSGSTQTMMMIIAGSSFAFLFFNRRPAKIYLGDTGSVFLGFALATTAARVSLGSGDFAAKHLVLIPLFLFAVPQIDAVLAIARRFSRGLPLMQGDRDHIHHKLLRIGLSVNQTVVVFYAVAIYAALSAITISHLENTLEITLVSALTASGLGVVLLAVAYAEMRLTSEKAQVALPHLKKVLSFSEPTSMRENFHAAVYDLEPYYKSLQTESIEKLTDFVSDFARTARMAHFDDASCKYEGRRLIIFDSQAIDQRRCEEAFADVLVRHGLTAAPTRLPAGVTFYSQANGEEFSRKFRSRRTDGKMAA